MRRAAGLLLALLCAGCALTGPAPEVEVASVELRGAGGLSQELGVTLCVTNPGASEISLRRIRVALDAAGAPLAEGVSEVPVRVPPGASATVPFTVVTTVANLGPQIAAVAQTGALDYRLHGSVTLDTLGLTLPFSRSGRLGLLQAGLALVDRGPTSGLRCRAG